MVYNKKVIIIYFSIIPEENVFQRKNKKCPGF